MIGAFYLQSSYSMLKNMIPIEELILTCKKNDYNFIALSDEYLHGIADLYAMSKDLSAKPLIGMKLTVLEPIETSFLIYVKDDFGYENLLELSYLKSQNHHFDINDLITRQKGLIFITAGYDSVLDKSIIFGNEESIAGILNNYNKVFDDFYLGLSINYDIQKEISANEIYKISKSLKIPAVLVHQTSYLSFEDKVAYEALVKIDDNKNTIAQSTNYKFLTKDEILSIYKTYPSLEINNKNLVSSISYKFSPPKFTMPKYITKAKVTSKKYLTSLARVGMKKRLKNNNISNHKPYIKRLEHELKIINEMDFETYFLIVYDFVSYAKKNNILVGPGRGSAAGSLVSYCLGITDIDPIKYNLLFERFLNPARMSMPDIDLDFPDNKREEVINYVKNKYGQEHICSISTYGTFALKSSIRDIARVTGVDVNRVNGIIQSVINNTVDESDEEISKLLNISKRIEGLPRHTGTHAAGIILADQNLSKHLPMQTGSYDFQQSQLNASWLEKLGLIKIDFLGIRNLTIISEILDVLNEKAINLDILNLDLEDMKTFRLLSSGDTTGIFQLESSGMRNVLKKLKPTSFEDIIAVLALYRPGPMDNIDTYIERRKGGRFEYLHKDLQPILKSTYGIIIYQEQIMQIAQVYAGYNLFEADMLRVGISKKDHNILEKERNKFVRMSINNGHTAKISEEIYNYIVKFADYGFNRSHSVSYSMIAFQMAYLKANYYEVFMSVLLNHVIGNDNQTTKYVNEAKSRGIKVLNPDLNLSTNKFISSNKKLLTPLVSIKGIGKKTYELIEKERQNGKFLKLSEIKKRLSNILSNNEFKSLISAGCLDYLGLNRRTLIKNSDLSNADYEQYMADYEVRSLKDYSYEENMELEKAALGFNLKYNLLFMYEEEASSMGYKSLADAHNTDNTIPVLAIIKDSTEHTTKKGEKMLFLTISDGVDEMDLAVFPDTYRQYKRHLKSGAYAFYVRANNYNNERRYTLMKIALLKAKDHI